MSFDHLTGDERAAAAYAQQAIKPEGLALAVTVVTLLLFCIATITVGLRLYVRIMLLRIWGLDDTLAICGYVMFIPTTIFTVWAAHYGIGTPDEDLNEFIKIRGIEYNFYWQISYMLLLVFAKASIAIALLRLTLQRRYRYPLHTIIIASTGVAVGGVIAVLAMCKPIAATWNPALGTCSSYTITLVASYSMTAIGPTMDFACAIIPYFLLRRHPMKNMAKYAIMIVLGLGVFASTGTLIRVPYFQAYSSSVQQPYNMGGIALWSNIEGGLGLIAGSLPPLGRLFTKYFGESSKSSALNNHRLASRTVGGSPFSTTSQLDGLTPKSKRASTSYIQGGRRWSRLDNDDGSGRFILQERSVRINTQSTSDEEQPMPLAESGLSFGKVV